MRPMIAPAIAALALVACSAATDIAGAEAASARTLVVTGLGEATAAPDLLTLTIGVETQGETAAAALRQNSTQMSATIERLKARGVAETDMQTSNLSVSPRYVYRENESPRIAGFTATNMLTVRLKDVDSAGALIDEAVSDGANNLGGLVFGFDDDTALMSEARAAAVSDAMRKAEAMARAAGVTLGPILRIQEGFAAAPPAPYLEMSVRSMDAAQAAPIMAGESTLTANVTLVYEIR